MAVADNTPIRKRLTLNGDMTLENLVDAKEVLERLSFGYMSVTGMREPGSTEVKKECCLGMR